MNILVTGANGQVGRTLREVTRGSSDRYLFSDVGQVGDFETLYLDVTNMDALDIICESEMVDFIVNCASFPDIAMAEDDHVMADLINREGPANVAKVAARRNIPLIHLSSSFVISGESGLPAREDQSPSPWGVFGVTKFAGEVAVKSSKCRFLILRTGWLYSPYGRNPLTDLLKFCAMHRSVKMPYDRVGTPTSAYTVCRFITDIIGSRDFSRFSSSERGVDGIYNLTDEGIASWYDFAQSAVSLYGLPVNVIPALWDESHLKERAPVYSVLDKALVKKDFGITLPHWRDSLSECIRKIKEADPENGYNKTN